MKNSFQKFHVSFQERSDDGRKKANQPTEWIRNEKRNVKFNETKWAEFLAANNKLTETILISAMKSRFNDPKTPR